MSSVLEVQQLCKRFGGLQATDHVNLCVKTQQLHALIGPNGAGKSTLMAQLIGELRPDSGQIHYLGQDISRWSRPQRALAGMARSYQITQLLSGFSVLDNVLMMLLAQKTNRIGALAPVRYDPVLHAQALAALEQVNLADRAQESIENLAHGEQRQLELAMVLAVKPKLLLLDEPLAGMSQAESQAMTQLLLQLKGQYSILLVEHDMDAVFRLADTVSVLVYGKVIASDTPTAIQQNASVRQAYLGDEEGV